MCLNLQCSGSFAYFRQSKHWVRVTYHCCTHPLLYLSLVAPMLAQCTHPYFMHNSFSMHPSLMHPFLLHALFIPAWYTHPQCLIHPSLLDTPILSAWYIHPQCLIHPSSVLDTPIPAWYIHPCLIHPSSVLDTQIPAWYTIHSQCTHPYFIPVWSQKNVKYSCFLTESRICPTGYFSCKNGRCVPGNRQCNKVDDCQDGSDEQNCGCGPDEFKCHNGSCIQVRLVIMDSDDCYVCNK